MSGMILRADARHLPIADGTAQCCVTSPPYWGLRDYGVAEQIGLEQTPDAYVAELVAVFREVWRVLRDDGVLWLNLGDSYANDGKWGGSSGGKHVAALHGQTGIGRQKVTTGLKPKDLVGIPWRVAFALQADGWYLRSDIIWHKPDTMPESVTDRPTKAHEMVFLLTKSGRYFYNAAAIAEQISEARVSARITGRGQGKEASRQPAGRQPQRANSGGFPTTGVRNARTVWTIAKQRYSGAHFATMPEALAERCILAGSRPGNLVLDPFGGSGTTARAAVSLGRRAVVTEINTAYLALARERTMVTRGLPLEVSA